MKNSSKKLVLLCGVAGLVVSAGIIIGILVNGNSTTATSAAAPTDKIITHSTDNPDETPIDKETFRWKGKGTDPKYITLPSIHGEGFLQKVGVDQRKEVGVPSNIHLAAWFAQSALPGADGLSIIDGHVDGKTQPGVFKNLGNLKSGQKFTVEMGNGNTTTFVVHKVQTVDEANAPSVLFSADLGQKSQLNLITCGGKYDAKAHHYKQRIIVTSSPVN